MLHFHFYDTALSRNQYQEKFSELLCKKYQKNDEGMYKTLNKRQSIAIQNARKLYTLQHKRPLKEQNPITTVFF